MIVQYWSPDPPPPSIATRLKTFAVHNPDIPHVVFNESRAEAFLSEHFSAREVEAFRSCTLQAMKADYFRYCAIFALGGLYLDADWHCLGDLRPVLEGPESGLLFGYPDVPWKRLRPFFAPVAEVAGYRAVINGIFRFSEPGHPFLAAAIAVATANVERRIVDRAAGVWLSTGPGVFSMIFAHSKLGSVDAYRSYCKGTLMEGYSDLVCEVLEEYPELRDAVEELRIEPFDAVDPCLRPDRIPPDELDSPHWISFDGNIFR